jgi:hypothetical protein
MADVALHAIQQYFFIFLSVCWIIEISVWLTELSFAIEVVVFWHLVGFILVLK